MLRGVKSQVRRLVEKRLSPLNQWRLACFDHIRHPLSSPTQRECNLCGYSGYMRPFGFPVRLEAQCGKCGSLERHRLFKLWLDEHPSFGKGRLLHFAPEPAMKALLGSRSADYTTADIDPGVGDVVLDIENIDLPDSSVDAIFCSHVLEHVDDKKALAELRRILTPGSVAILLVPAIEGRTHTYENPAIISAADRKLHFGQEDHVRIYGPDLRERIRGAGFSLTEYTAEDVTLVNRFGLLHGDKIFVATKVEG